MSNNIVWRQLPNDIIELPNGNINLYSILNKWDAEIPTIKSITRHNAEDAFKKHFKGHDTEIADYVIVKYSNNYYIIWLNGPPTDDNQYTGIKDAIIKGIKGGIINVTLASKEKRKSNNKKSEDGNFGGSRRSRYSKKSKRSKRSKQTRRSKK